jgi:hypothetical protein
MIVLVCLMPYPSMLAQPLGKEGHKLLERERRTGERLL